MRSSASITSAMSDEFFPFMYEDGWCAMTAGPASFFSKLRSRAIESLAVLTPRQAVVPNRSQDAVQEVSEAHPQCGTICGNRTIYNL